MSISPIEWDSKYELGHSLIDDDHQELFRFVSDFIDSVNNGANYEVTKYTLYNAIRYANTHFEHEEQIMKRALYPKLNAHKELHETFKITITKYAKEFINTRVDSEELSKYFHNWIVSHVLVHDKEFGEFIEKNKSFG